MHNAAPYLTPHKSIIIIIIIIPHSFHSEKIVQQ